jgi:NAD(P)-dependent dehydrogenase (short-subunit alcohol dehydrogenase family)
MSTSANTSDHLRFDGRVALITGAGRGLGRAYALLLASRGARVVVNDLGVGTDGIGPASAEPAGLVADEIAAAGGQAIADGNSVAAAAGGRAMVGSALQVWGRVDVVVHNAGIESTEHRFDELGDEQVRRVVDTHLLGAFHVLRPAWPVMRQQGYGRVVLIASAMALGAPFGFDYCAAKGGLISLARSLALSGADDGIKVNAVMPTAWTRLSEVASDAATGAWLQRNFPAESVAPAVACLSHERVPVSGETFSVGAGSIARVFYGAVPGYTSPQLTSEDIDTHLGEILDVANFVVATSGRSDGAFFAIQAPAHGPGAGTT